MPYTVVPDENFSNQNFFINNSDKTVWFKFIANYAITEVYSDENASVTTSTHAMQIDFYSGSCGALSLVQSQSFDDSPQGERSITLSNLNFGQTYFVKITAKNPNSNLLMAFINLKSSSPLVCGLPNSIFLGNATIPSTLHITTDAISMNGLFIGSTWTFSNQNYWVFANTTILIDAEATFNSCNFILNSGCVIKYVTTNNGTSAKLKLDKCYLGGCQNMWIGIQAYFQDFLQITNSVIEDAFKAVDVSNVSNFQLIVTSTVFNKNLCGIYVSSSNVNFIVKDNVFTSRLLYNSIPAMPAVSNLKPSTLILQNYSFSTPGIGASLKFPNNSKKRGMFGIQMINSNLIASNSNQIIGSPAAGPTKFNFFENVDYGIDVRRSIISIQNNMFCAGDGSINYNFSAPYASTGVGIVSLGNSLQNQYKITAGGMGISSSNYQPNYFWVSPNPAILYNFTTISFINNKISGCGPLLINPSRGGAVACSYNKTNPNTSNNDFRINLTNTFNSVITVYGNTLEGSFSGISGNNSIMVQNSSFGSNNTISINNNYLLVGGAIWLSSILGSTTDISYNYITLSRAINPTSPGFLHGIRLQGSDHTKIHDNTIIGNITSAFNFSPLPLKYGIRGITLEQSNECNVNCNYVGNVDQAIIFNGNCLTTTGSKEVVFTNEMRDSYQGLVLENSGIIGQQGSGTSPSDNLWTTIGSLSWNAQAYSINSSGASSPLYCRNSAGYFPNPNLSIPIGFQFGLNSSSGTRPFCAPCIGAGCLPPSFLAAALEDMIKSADANPDLAKETEWLNKKYALDMLLNEPSTITTNDSILNEFADSARYGNLGDILETERLLKIKDYVNAKILSDNLSPENQMEINLKIYNSLFSAWQLNPLMEFTDTQIADLQYVAYQCCYSGGVAVLQSRGFLAYLFLSNINFPDECIIPFSSERKANSVKVFEAKKIEYNNYDDVAISPNPASNYVSIIKDRDNKEFDFILFNTLGEIVYKKNNVKSDERININTISQGFYSYKLITKQGKVSKGKLIIKPN